MNHRIATAAIALGLFVCLPLRASAQKLAAELVDPDRKALKKSATITVHVSGIKMIDSAAAKEKPVKGQGHLHYKIDNGLIIATTATKLSFHELSSGAHSFTVNLAGNDHSPLGPSQTLNVTVP